jgi:hypothetical protein
MRMKAEDVEVNDPDEAMSRFKAALGKLVKIPKSAIKAKRKRGPKKKRKG